MEDNTDYNLIAKFFAGECSAEEEAFIQKKMREDQGVAELVREFEKIWLLKHTNEEGFWEKDKIWAELNNKIELSQAEKLLPRIEKPLHLAYAKSAGSRKNGMNWFIRIAAVVTIIASVGLVTMFHMNNTQAEEPELMRQVVADMGQRATVQLEDGSRIRLNSGSRLIHPAEFNEHERTVQLEGEGYFEIARDERPFFVHADEAIIEVLGTEFNVLAYEDSHEIQVVVAEGTVSLSSGVSSDKESVTLEKNDLATLSRGTDTEPELMLRQNVTISEYLGWLNYKLAFDNDPMSIAALKIERWYGVNIEFSDAGIEDMNLSAQFEDVSIHEILRVMSITLDIEYEIKGRNITLTR